MNKVNGRLLGQAIKYFFVGGVCTFVDFVILYPQIRNYAPI